MVRAICSYRISTVINRGVLIGGLGNAIPPLFYNWSVNGQMVSYSSKLLFPLYLNVHFRFFLKTRLEAMPFS